MEVICPECREPLDIARGGTTSGIVKCKNGHLWDIRLQRRSNNRWIQGFWDVVGHT